MPAEYNLQARYERWQMAKNTNAEAIVRGLPPAVLAWTLARENSTWQAYAQAVEALA